MNVKRYLTASFALFIFIMLFEWLVHGFILRGVYHRTPEVWRCMTDMAVYMPLAILFQLVLAFWLGFVFSRLYPRGGVENGWRFGVYFGVFAAILSSSWFIWLAVSAILGLAWFISALIQGIVGGLILGALYRK